jgi:hypothetical protein
MGYDRFRSRRSDPDMASVDCGDGFCRLVLLKKEKCAVAPKIRSEIGGWCRKYAKERLPEDGIDYEPAEDEAPMDAVGLWVNNVRPRLLAT